VSEGPLSLQPEPSRCLLGAVVGLHLAALAALWLADLSPWLQLALTLALGVSAVQQWHSLDGTSVQAVTRLVIDPQGISWFTDRSGTRFQVDRIEAGLVSPLITLVRLHTAARRGRWLVFCHDSLSATDHRRLRVFLRWGNSYRETAP